MDPHKTAAGLLTRLEHIARAERRAELDEDWPLYTTARTLRYCLKNEWQRLADRTITGIEIPAEAIPTAADARSIIAAESAEQDRIGKQRHLAAAKQTALQFDQLASEAPGQWGERAREHRRYIYGFTHQRGEHAGLELRTHGITRTRSRGAGRPRARRAAARSSSSSADSGGDTGPGEPGEGEPERAAPETVSYVFGPLAGRTRLLCDSAARIGVVPV
jgi:hypothetical protein